MDDCVPRLVWSEGILKIKIASPTTSFLDPRGQTQFISLLEGLIMRLTYSPEIPKQWFKESGVLKPLSESPSMREVVDQVKLFKRDGVIYVALACLWALWHRLHSPIHPDNLLMHTSNFLLRSHAANLIILAAMFCEEEGYLDPKEVDIRILTWQFHSILDSISDKEWLQTEEITRIKARLAGDDMDPRLKGIPEGDLMKICLELFRVRLGYQEWHTYSFYDSDWVRALLIYKEFRNIVKKNPSVRLEEFEEKYLGTSYERFLRAGWGLFAVVNESSKNLDKAGFIDFGSLNVESGIRERLGIGADDLRIVARRLSLLISDFKKLSHDLWKIKEPVQKHGEILDRLAVKPIILLDKYAESEKRNLIPSPWMFLAAIRTFLLHEFVDALYSDRENTLAGLDAYSVRGEAFAAYLKKVFKANPDIVNVDDLDKENEKKPDFLWNGVRYSIIIEAKYRLKGNRDRTCLEPGTLLEAWQTGIKGINQASGFLNRNISIVTDIDKPHRRRKVLAIVTEEALPEELTGFKSAAKRWGFLNGTTIDAIALFSPAELEYYVLNRSPDELGDSIAKAWDKVEPDSLDRELRDFSVSEAIQLAPLSPAIEAGWNELLPGSKPRNKNRSDTT